MATRTIRLDWTQLVTSSTSDEFQPCTAWMDASNIAAGRALFELGAVGGAGTTTVTPAYQVADHPDEPSTVTAIGSGQFAKDVYYPSSYSDMTTGTQGDQLVRFGFYIKSSSGTGWARARAKIDLVDR